YTAGITPPVWGISYWQSAAINNDPQVWWLQFDNKPAIDASKYRYMSIGMYLQAPLQNPTAQFNGGPRMLWSQQGNNNLTVSKLVAAQYSRWLPMTFDMPNVPVETGSNTWNGQIGSFRFDPHEEDGGSDPNWILPEWFRINSAHLTSIPVTAKGTLIRWTSMQGSGLVDLYYDSDNSGHNGTLIASGIPLSQGSYTWNSSSVPNGTYYIYTVAQDSYRRSNSWYSLVPVIVNHAGISTIFTDVPTNNYAVNPINDLAVRGIIGGYLQDDSTLLFKPGNNASRAQLAKIVVLGAGGRLVNPSTPTFADVPTSSPLYTYVETASSRGYISGYACGGAGEPCDGQNSPYFRPNNLVTRAQTAKLVDQMKGWAAYNPTVGTFEDISNTSPLYGYVEASAQHSIIGGYACGGTNPATGQPEPCGSGNRPYFRPGNLVTRAQISIMISRALAP
ncbi:MAG: S-layer homology domain-containing protein, partial [Chloroflexota bacterium]|nr:S-layer homology domain-containing protein [Chloroflexota bacterium]